MSLIGRINIDLPQRPIATPGSVQPSKNKSFTDVLKGEINKNGAVKFSEHAITRLKDRHIELTDRDHSLINEAVERVAQKGARESLLLLNNLALLVSVKNKTVITAMDQQAQSGKIFTNIDSAMIIR